MRQRQGRKVQGRQAAQQMGTVADILALVCEFPIDTVKELAPEVQTFDASVRGACQHEQSVQAAAANA